MRPISKMNSIDPRSAEVDGNEYGLALKRSSPVSSTESDDDADSVASSDTSADIHESDSPAISKRQANQNAFFEHLKKDDNKVQETIDGEISSTKAQIATTANRIIDRVRDYQQELFERAKDENIITVLDTGSGKTLIACLLIRHVLEEESLRRVSDGTQKFIFFLANSVHLVQQQGRVLKDNLIDTPVVLHGDTNADLWARPAWDQIREKNKVVVCTPEVLNQCLMHSFLRMNEISLLVFDEAHHAKKNHPYSRIIRSYYLKCGTDSRPKIFGMTASAVDTKGEISKQAADLEELLQAKIVTTDDGSLLSFAPKPTDIKWVYHRPQNQLRTDLHRQIAEKVSFCEDLKRGFAFASKAVTELGPWCADQVWKYAIGNSSNVSSSVRRKFEVSKTYANFSSVEEREQHLRAIDDATDLVHEYFADPPEPTYQNLSSKVIMLHQQLSQYYQHNPNTRAIVFIDERLKALVLHDCFSKLEIKGIRVGVLLGIAGTSFEAVSTKHQEQMLQRFRAGLINLVFATSVADEGLDIPQCNLCVRFDLCKTTIQYIQSRGRARMPGSHFAHMIENGNVVQDDEVNYQIENEQYHKRYYESLPLDRKLGRGTQLEKLLAQDERGGSFETSAGVICDNSNALTILARFATSLQHTGSVDREIYEEEIDAENIRFRYLVRLPASDQCDIRGARGQWKPSKQQAKRAAAVDCCKLLRRKEYLDESLNSIFVKVKPENANALLAVNEKKTAYDMQTKPSAWLRDLDMVPVQLHVNLLTFHSERHLRRQPAPMALLTKSKLPRIPAFDAYLEDKVKTEIRITSLVEPISVTNEEVTLLTEFTLRGVFEDVFNKIYDIQPEKMSYWLTPVANISTTPQHLADITDLSVLKVVHNERRAWNSDTTPETWAQSFLCDPYNGKFHYFTSNVAPGVKITDPVPDYVPRISQKKRKNIIDFSDSLWTATKKKITEAQVYDQNQPVYVADLVGTRRNFLDASASQDLISCLVAPQNLQVARIDAGFASSCVIWPAIIHRIESYMIVLEAFEKLDLPGVSPELALEAFTKDADNDDEEFQTHTGGRRGMGKNYERLEFIGDSLLKMTTTMTVFNRTICDEEGMHCRRMAILCNRNLFNVSVSEELQLYRYARTLAFDRTTWYPEFVTLLKGRGAKKEPEPTIHQPKFQDLGKKTIADMSEAIIGAAITATRNLPVKKGRFDLGIRAITKLAKSEDHAVNSWADIAAQYAAPEWSLQMNDPIANDRARLVGARTGYQFKNPRLLRSAFTHSSDINSPVPDLQRLEFLGDAVLDWVCISWLFETNPSRNPQWLTEHKMAMVSNKFLAALAVILDFDKFIFVTTAKLIGGISTYAAAVRAALEEPDCPNNFWTTIDNPPKALSDLVESYLGAVLVDSNFDYTEMERFFEMHIKKFFANISDYDTFANRQPTTYLYQRLSQDFKCRNYDILDSGNRLVDKASDEQVIAGVLIHGKMVAQDSSGTGVRYACVRASKKALAKLDGLSRDEFRKEYGCDCIVSD